MDWDRTHWTEWYWDESLRTGAQGGLFIESVVQFSLIDAFEPPLDVVSCALGQEQYLSSILPRLFCNLMLLWVFEHMTELIATLRNDLGSELRKLTCECFHSGSSLRDNV